MILSYEYFAVRYGSFHMIPFHSMITSNLFTFSSQNETIYVRFLLLLFLVHINPMCAIKLAQQHWNSQMQAEKCHIQTDKSDRNSFLYSQQYNEKAVSAFCAMYCTIWGCDTLIPVAESWLKREKASNLVVIVFVFLFFFFWYAKNTQQSNSWNKIHVSNACFWLINAGRSHVGTNVTSFFFVSSLVSIFCVIFSGELFDNLVHLCQKYRPSAITVNAVRLCLQMTHLAM